jgi:hypothetical protein
MLAKQAVASIGYQDYDMIPKDELIGNDEGGKVYISGVLEGRNLWNRIYSTT